MLRLAAAMPTEDGRRRDGLRKVPEDLRFAVRDVVVEDDDVGGLVDVAPDIDGAGDGADDLGAMVRQKVFDEVLAFGEDVAQCIDVTEVLRRLHRLHARSSRVTPFQFPLRSMKTSFHTSNM